jgi:hypothetical protein
MKHTIAPSTITIKPGMNNSISSNMSHDRLKVLSYNNIYEALIHPILDPLEF